LSDDDARRVEAELTARILQEVGRYRTELPVGAYL
jgi:hypothetical protein